MFCLPLKYSYFVIVIDLKRMVLIIVPLYSQLPVLANQVAEIPVPKLCHQIYQNSDWYSKIVSFFLDDLITLDNLDHTMKKVVKQASIKYQIIDQHLFYFEQCGKTEKYPLLYKIFFILKYTHNKYGHFLS